MGRFHGFLCEAVDIQKYRASGGKRKERHYHKLKLVIIKETQLPEAFTVSLRPEMNMTYRIAMSMADKMGISINEYENSLSEEFKKHFIINTGMKKSENLIIPTQMQKLLVDCAESSGSKANIIEFLKNGAAFFAPQRGKTR